MTSDGLQTAGLLLTLGMSWFARSKAAVAPPPEADAAPAIAKRLNQELAELARGLSHDVAGPLRTLEAALRLVESDIAAGKTERSLQTLAAIRAQTRHLSDVSGGLVTYCRSAWTECPAQTVCLQSLVERVASPMNRTDGPTLDVRVSRRQITAEIDALQRCLHELLHNACTHHDRGTAGRVVVQARIEPARPAAPRSHTLHLTVEDDGPGITADMQRAVFDFFRRATTTAPGAGLGLSLVNTLTQRFGGRVALEDAPSRGLRAQLSWPVTLHPSPREVRP